jgi:hypothetical protein
MIPVSATLNSKNRVTPGISNAVAASEDTGEPFSLEQTCHG